VSSLHLGDPSKDEPEAGEKMMLDGEETSPDVDLTDDQIPEDDGDSEYEDVEDAEDYNTLNHQLDSLNTALDVLEQKNDSITAQLLELLHESREVRQTIAKEKEGQTAE